MKYICYSDLSKLFIVENKAPSTSLVANASILLVNKIIQEGFYRNTIDLVFNYNETFVARICYSNNDKGYNLYFGIHTPAPDVANFAFCVYRDTDVHGKDPIDNKLKKYNSVSSLTYDIKKTINFRKMIKEVFKK